MLLSEYKVLQPIQNSDLQAVQVSNSTWLYKENDTIRIIAVLFVFTLWHNISVGTIPSIMQTIHIVKTFNSIIFINGGGLS